MIEYPEPESTGRKCVVFGGKDHGFDPHFVTRTCAAPRRTGIGTHGL
jgi:hypothetical protein